MRSLFKKTALKTSMFFLIIMAVSSAAIILYLDNSYKNNMENDLLSQARVIESLYTTNDQASSYAKTLYKIKGVRTTIIDYQGRVMLDTEADISTLDNHLTRPEVQEALKDGQGVDIRHSATLDQELMYAAIYSQNAHVFIRTALPLKGVDTYATGLWLPLVIILIFLYLLCLLISLVVSRQVVKPIIRLKDDTQKIIKGQYDEILPIKTGDEIESLSVSLSSMAYELKKNINDITEKNTRLQAVFKAVPGGILAVDNDHKVIMANPAALKMFSITGNTEGRHFIEVVNNSKIESVIQEAFSGGLVEKEITIQKGMEETYLQIFAVPVKSDNAEYGVILLAQDITKLKKLENIRSEFAANVSHELKTPLTVIRGFIDTLKDPGIDKNDSARFLDIISLESERLTRLIDDVLLLSEIENTAVLPSSITDIRESVNEAVQLLENKAKDKNISLNIKLCEEGVMVRAEKDRIKQMVINLVDNAIKYTPSGGNVDISVERENSRGIISVADTGIGIPNENIPRLFERFYRVDKSRSRALGGTGLGLAIVKHIVSLLNGHITVQSAVGKGSRFNIYLPIEDK